MRRSTKWLGASAALLVTLALAAGIDPQALPVPIRLAGRLHPLIVHFPIGLLLLALLFRFLARKPVGMISLGNSADLIWDLNYEINWDVTDALALRLGWNRARRMYDGAAEYQTFWLAALDGRF